MKTYWCSWWSKDRPATDEAYNAIYWVSGQRDVNQPWECEESICGYVEAESPERAEAMVRKRWGDLVTEWRFAEVREIVEVSDRFPLLSLASIWASGRRALAMREEAPSQQDPRDDDRP
jgi:hypothetical protein